MRRVQLATIDDDAVDTDMASQQCERYAYAYDGGDNQILMAAERTDGIDTVLLKKERHEHEDAVYHDKIQRKQGDTAQRAVDVSSHECWSALRGILVDHSDQFSLCLLKMHHTT